ncbi:hypothetical protein GCM10023116_40960 [Kistimonas scapharcae]|uniref:Uncharacterized protein n=1 Tax=Kistimonas scapharcae TaxID=1036133 RepID=A0ABP8VA09_9GAMM
MMTSCEAHLLKAVESLTLSPEEYEALYSFIGYYKNFCQAVMHYSTAMDTLRTPLFSNNLHPSQGSCHEQRTT